MARPLRQTYVTKTVLDPAGEGTATIVIRQDFILMHMRVSVNTASDQPTATTFINGVQYEGSAAGSDDQSATLELLLGSDELTCVWTGGDPGATATFVARGIEFPPGEGIAALVRMGGAAR